ncbi:hypothetical protein HDV00_009300 [Rhizophlyctis rosea]|nr:hypothetical protein HDV00_009300 [Rhizophlyctis rosea]
MRPYKLQGLVTRKMPATPTILTIPDEITRDIFAHLRFFTIYRCYQACKTWRNGLLSPTSSVWRDVLMTQFPPNARPPPLLPNETWLDVLRVYDTWRVGWSEKGDRCDDYDHERAGHPREEQACYRVDWDDVEDSEEEGDQMDGVGENGNWEQEDIDDEDSISSNDGYDENEEDGYRRPYKRRPKIITEQQTLDPKSTFQRTTLLTANVWIQCADPFPHNPQPFLNDIHEFSDKRQFSSCRTDLYAKETFPDGIDLYTTSTKALFLETPFGPGHHTSLCGRTLVVHTSSNHINIWLLPPSDDAGRPTGDPVAVVIRDGHFDAQHYGQLGARNILHNESFLAFISDCGGRGRHIRLYQLPSYSEASAKAVVVDGSDKDSHSHSSDLGSNSAFVNWNRQYTATGSLVATYGVELEDDWDGRPSTNLAFMTRTHLIGDGNSYGNGYLNIHRLSDLFRVGRISCKIGWGGFPHAFTMTEDGSRIVGIGDGGRKGGKFLMVMNPFGEWSKWRVPKLPKGRRDGRKSDYGDPANEGLWVYVRDRKIVDGRAWGHGRGRVIWKRLKVAKGAEMDGAENEVGKTELKGDDGSIAG